VKTIYVLYHMARADFLERVRRYSFLLTLGVAALLASGVYRGQIVLTLGRYCGAPNSAWFGAFLAIVATTFLSVVGFYIVKNAVQRDVETRVGSILAATPLSRFVYTLGKTVSNFAVLAAMVLVLASGATVLQLVRGGGGIDWWQMLSPFLLVAIPAMASIAALAVLFEIVPGLRGGLGNVLYFFCFTGLLATSFELKKLDFTGVNVYMESMSAVVRRLDPAYRNSFALQIGPARVATRQFSWNGLHWTVAMVSERLFWIGMALVLSYVASVLFHRFDPAREPRRLQRKDASSQSPVVRIQPTMTANVTARLAALGSVGGGSFGLTRAELRLMLKDVSPWWYLVAVGLWIASLATPLAISRGILVAVWIWPLLLWSRMGTRESCHQTSAFIFSAARSLQRQFPAAWLAGVIVALVTGSGVALRLLLAGDLHGCAGWLAGAVFIPTLALALGTWSGTSKTFEAVYTFWWYAGPGNHVPYADFMGTAAGSGQPGLYCLLTAVLLVAAFVGRRAKLAYA
jgi:hypothetical protein